MEPLEGEEMPSSGQFGMYGRAALLVLLLTMGSGMKALAFIPVCYLLYLGFLWAVQCHMLFPLISMKPQQHPAPPEGCRVSWVDSDDGSSEAWFYKAKRQPAGGLVPPTVVVFHGNGEYISSYPVVTEWFTSQGYNVLLPEYRGYGRCAGTPTEQEIVSDVLRHFDSLAADAEASQWLNLHNLIYFGVSVGGGVASAVAARHAPRAMVLLSTFYSVPMVAATYGVPEAIARSLLVNVYDNAANLRCLLDKAKVPIFLSHGTKDELVPFEHAERLSAELGVDVYTRPCGHNDFAFDDEYCRRLSTFLAPISPMPPSPAAAAGRTPRASVHPASP